ncbi:MAG: cupin domain-containing protein [Aestuariivirga sp.]
MSVTIALPETYDVLAPDGSEVRILASAKAGSMAHFQLPPGAISKPVAHRTVEELWYIVEGKGRMWRKHESSESIVELKAGTSISIPIGTSFQFRNDGGTSLAAVGVTMPPWPGMDEAYAVKGKW